MGDKPCETCSAGGSGGATDADDGADAGGWEHVGWCGEEVGRPSLMSGGGETEEPDGGPRIIGEERVHVRDEHDGKHTDGADEEREFSAGVYGVTVLHAEAGEPATCDGTDAGAGVDDDEWVFDVAEIEAVVVVEELGEIEEIEPPDGVGDSFGDAEGPEAAMAQKDGVDWSAALGDGGEVCLSLSGAATKLVVRKDEPNDGPDESHGASADEGGLPSPPGGDCCDKGGCDKGGCVGAGVEEAGGERALFGGEPLGGGLDGGGEVS